MRYVALLRAIANVSMAPFRQAMEEMGFSDVESLGAARSAGIVDQIRERLRRSA
jgi:uncharacterized protein (DUF1697 family)